MMKFIFSLRLNLFDGVCMCLSTVAVASEHYVAFILIAVVGGIISALCEAATQ